MTSFKTIFLALLVGSLSVVAWAQTAKTTQTGSVKTSTGTAKPSTPAKTKAPQTISKTTTAKKTATKTLQKTSTAKNVVTPQKTNTTNLPTKVVTPVPVKMEPASPNKTTQTGIPSAPVNGGKINTGSGTETNTNTNNNTNTGSGTGGKVVIGGNTDNNTNTGGGNSVINTITEGDASSAIKEALIKGVQVGVDKVSVTDGYFGNNIIKIPFPAQVKQVESTLRSVGMGSVVDNAVLSMNRAAESAAKQAGPIFLNGIKQMTVTDAVNIVSNQQPDAATQFLKRTTTESLVASFKPSIKTALDKTLATKYWGDITGYYNKLPFVNPVNTDLPDYVTRKAIDGLFYMVAQEEAKIRKDPLNETSNIIKDVFGKVKF